MGEKGETEDRQHSRARCMEEEEEEEEEGGGEGA